VFVVCGLTANGGLCNEEMSILSMNPDISVANEPPTLEALLLMIVVGVN
jgi:hypothetical protein